MILPFDLRIQHDTYGNAPHLLSPADAERLEAGNWYRADGNVPCEVCGKIAYDHAPVIGALWLLRLCNGDLIKF